MVEAGPEWVAPLLRGIVGLAAFALLVFIGRRQFIGRRENDPFDSGLD